MKNLLKLYNFSNYTFTNGRGVYLFDKNNKKFIDFSSGIAVNALGYNHSLVNKTIKDQLKTGILHLSGSQIHKYKLELASLLSKITNKGKVFFSNSGTESIEAAIKFARIWGHLNNKKFEIISMKNGFHGRTLGSLSLGSNKFYKNNMGQILKNVKFCKFNDVEHLKKLVNPKKTLAIILECIQGDGGIHICSKEFSKSIKAICKKHNILLIIDEIQTGIGRTGKIFSYKHYGFQPDIITISKALGTGYPIAATILNTKISKVLKLGQHGSTFGGGMMQTRIALNVVKFINRKKFLLEIKKNEIYLKKILNLLKKQFPNVIKEIRGLGLMYGVELKNNYNVGKITNYCLNNGLIISGLSNNIIRITPPLIINKKEIKFGIKILKNTFKKILNN